MERTRKTGFDPRRDFGLRVGWAGARDKRVLNAFGEVDRALFVPENMLHLAHTNSTIVLAKDSTISEPLLVAEMIDHLSLSPKDNVLEIGTASGYSAAVLSYLARKVHTVEINADLAKSAKERLENLGYDNVLVHCMDGGYGLPEYAPFNGIIVTAAAKDVPEKLIEQLAIGGRLVVPIAKDHPNLGKLHIFQKIDKHTIFQKEGGEVSFVPLVSDAPGCWKQEEVNSLPSISTLRIRAIAKMVLLSEQELRKTIAEKAGNIDPQDDNKVLEAFSRRSIQEDLVTGISARREQLIESLQAKS